jgi:hypothetical protein
MAQNQRVKGTPVGPSISPGDGIRLLRKQHQQGSALLKHRPINTAEYSAWINTTREYLIMAFGSGSENIRQIIGGIAVGFAGESEAYQENRRAERLGNQLILLSSALEQLETQIEIKKQEVESETENSMDRAVSIIEHVCQRFHNIVRQLRHRYNNRPTLDVNDEYDAQNLLHVLLCLHFDDIRPEEWTPSYAGKSSRMDFLLKPETTIVEVKMTRDGLTEKEVGSQLIEDIARYKVHPDCKTLICFVYDPGGRISNPRGFENDMSNHGESIIVKVFVTP